MSSLPLAISDANNDSGNASIDGGSLSQLDTSVRQNRSSGLYDFPTPPTEFPKLILCPVQSPDYPAENRYSHATSASSPEPLPYLSNELQFKGDPKTESTNDLLKLKRISKSTTSLPIPLSGHCYMDDHLLSSNYSFLEPIQENYKGQQTSMQPRATKSYHNLKADEESPPLNQSFFSLASRGRGIDVGGEPMPEIADLLSPIDSSSIKSEMEKSSGTITLVSHVYGQRSTASSGENHHRRDGSSGDVIAEQSLTRMPMPSDGAMPSHQPLKRFSMANLGIQRSNRNSAVVSGTLITAADMDFTTGLTEKRPHSSCGKRHSKLLRQNKSNTKGNGRRRSFAHFKAHNQHQTDASNATSDSWTRAVNWSQRINNQGTVRQRDSQTSSSGNSAVIDQYKIYDIYEESVWHSAQTPQQKSSIEKFAADETITNKCSIDSGSTRSRHRFGSIGVGNSLSLRALRSMTSLGYPWRKNSIKSSRPPTEPEAPMQEAEEMEWECLSDCSCSTSIYSEHSSDASVLISEVYAQNKVEEEEEAIPKMPARRKSKIELLVRRAGVGILRRSTSLCKVISGASTRDPMDADSTIAESRNTLDSSSSKLEDGTNRLFTTMRLAGSRLKRSLKQKEKNDAAKIGGNKTDDHDGIVSAYPTDSLPGRELSSYLSLSAIYSPETHLSNSGPASNPSSTYNGGSTTCDSRTEEDIDAFSGESKARQSQYMPPKQPPFLGLHRRVATVSFPAEQQTPVDTSESKEDKEEDAVSRNPFRQCPSPSVYSSIGTRPRAKQLKSPFTTLPYGAYAQISQQLKSQEQQ